VYDAIGVESTTVGNFSLAREEISLTTPAIWLRSVPDFKA
jgi:hypothetical protein